MIQVTMTSNLKKYYPQSTFQIEASDLRELFKKMDAVRPGFSGYILEDNRVVRRHVNIFVNKELLAKDQVDFKLPKDCSVHIMQALSGG